MSLDQALQAVLDAAQAVSQTEFVATLQADGRVLAQDLVSALQVPPQDNSSMDGYAVRMCDVQQTGVRLKVTQRIPAGQNGTALNRGEAARIFTGAPIPPGADAVVMQEDAELLGGTPGQEPEVQINAVPSTGQWIRRSGEDVTQGAVVLPLGTRLDPASLGLAASIGLDQLKVVRRPRVALFSTGDELVMPGQVPPEKMRPGAIYNSNRFFLRALLLRLGCEVTDMGIVPDQRDATLAVLQTAAAEHDLILTSGGVSVGEEDHVKPAVEALGHLALWQISMKPGKPFAFGQVRRVSAVDAAVDETACFFHGLARQSRFQLYHFHALGQALFARFARGASSARSTAAFASQFQLAQGRPAPRIFTRQAGWRRRGRFVSQPKFGCADLGGLGRWGGRQPQWADHFAR